MNDLVSFLWHTAFTLLWCFIFLSVIAYRAGKDRVFIYYAAYIFLLLIYVGSRTQYFFDYNNSNELVRTIKRLFNWHIQVIYHFVHMFFGIVIVGIDTKYPKLYRNLKIYARISLTIGTLIPILVLLGYLTTIDYDKYFAFIHIPIFISVGVIILKKAWKENNFVVYCFFWGTLIYAVLSAAALTLTVLAGYGFRPLSHPLMLFYTGVIIETLAFAIGLGYRLQNVYKEKLQYQKDLTEAQIKLQEKLQEKLKIQEQENIELLRLKERQELETQLAQLQNKILRSQMNSHFIFNVLNSIKAFIIENDEKQAVNYLNKFSKFIRKVLDSNFYEENTLEEELNTMQLYLDIETMRLHNNFSYHINIENDLDISHIKFPALLLQPYIENAIWHGLMPQKGEKKLEINLIRKENRIAILIIDNGIGYEDSMRNKTENSHHKSFGLDIVNERIKEFNRKNTNTLSAKIMDQKTLGQSGTVVKIILTL
jgi:sensor histidine kinase YesM